MSKLLRSLLVAFSLYITTNDLSAQRKVDLQISPLFTDITSVDVGAQIQLPVYLNSTITFGPEYIIISERYTKENTTNDELKLSMIKHVLGVRFTKIFILNTDLKYTLFAGPRYYHINNFNYTETNFESSWDGYESKLGAYFGVNAHYAISKNTSFVAELNFHNFIGKIDTDAIEFEGRKERTSNGGIVSMGSDTFSEVERPFFISLGVHLNIL